MRSDEEFLLAAILHGIGKAIDQSDYVEAALQAVEGSIVERTRLLIAHHMDGNSMRAGTLGGEGASAERIEPKSRPNLVAFRCSDHFV